MDRNAQMIRFVRRVRMASAFVMGAGLLQVGSCAITAPDYFTYEILSMIRQIAINALTYGVFG